MEPVDAAGAAAPLNCEDDRVIVATWLMSGWIDVAMVAGWMAFVMAIARRVWRSGDE